MDRSSKRGKIPQQDWPSIIKRYEAGETLASIARTYDCSPPAISYIVSRSRAREVTAEGAVLEANGSPEPRLVKGQANDMPTAEVSLGGREVGDTSVENVGAEASHPAEGLRTEQPQPGPRHAANDAAGGAPSISRSPKTVLTMLMYSTKMHPGRTRLVPASAWRFDRQEANNKVSSTLVGRAPPSTHRPRTADQAT